MEGKDRVLLFLCGLTLMVYTVHLNKIAGDDLTFSEAWSIIVVFAVSFAAIHRAITGK